MVAEDTVAEVVTEEVEVVVVDTLLPTLLLSVEADGRRSYIRHWLEDFFRSHDLIPYRFERVAFQGVQEEAVRRTLHGSGGARFYQLYTPKELWM